MKENPIISKSESFAINIVNLYKEITTEKNEYVLSKQLLRSGTSIGANAAEAVRGQSSADFYAKMNISLKEASETQYWLNLLYKTDYINIEKYEKINNDCEELIRILVSITKKQKDN